MPSTGTPSADERLERVMVFIDGSNLYHVLSEVCGRHDLNFGKFAAKLAGDRKLIRTYYYNIRQDSDRDPGVATEQAKFLQTLYETPYLEIRMGISKRHGDTMVEKGVDVFMATDLVAYAFMDLYDSAIVVSGDGDFFPAIQTSKNQGKHITVAAFDNNLSSEAANVADEVLKLNKTYFTGLWSDRRRRTSDSGTASRSRTRSSTSRSTTTRSTRTSSRARSASASTANGTDNGTADDSAPDGAAPSTSADDAPKPPARRRRAPARRSAASSSSTSDGAATPTRRRSPSRRLAAPAESAGVSGDDGSSAPARTESDTPSTPVRRTPARRRVGGYNSGSSDEDASPRPPALRRPGNGNGDLSGS